MDIYQTEITKWIKEKQTQKAVAHVQCALQLFRLAANSYQTKPNFFVKAPLRGAFTKKLVVGLFAICCKSSFAYLLNYKFYE